MLLGHARGKVGDLVFSRSNGQQVVRARAAVVKNPQTESQMIQRVILNTVAQAYSRMQAITDHSFEGVQQGQKTMSIFLRKNLQGLRTKIANEIASGGELANVVAFTPIGQNGFAANDFIVSQGSLPEIVLENTSANNFQVNIGGTTYGDVLTTLGLKRGDQLTFICTQGSSMVNTTFHYARVILDPKSADGTDAPLTTPLVANGAINLPSSRNEGDFSTLAVSDAGVLTFTLGLASAIQQSGAIIASRQKSDGSWMRSNATMQVKSGVLGFLLSMQDCLDALTDDAFGTENPLYLNNAGTANLASAGSASLIDQLQGQQVFINPASKLRVQSMSPNLGVIYEGNLEGASIVASTTVGETASYFDIYVPSVVSEITVSDSTKVSFEDRGVVNGRHVWRIKPNVSTATTVDFVITTAVDGINLLSASIIVQSA